MIVLVHADAHVAVLDVCGSADGGITALTAQGRLLLHSLSTHLFLMAKYASSFPD